MKNVIIYNVVDNKLKYKNDYLFELLKSQIDNSLYYGWSPEDIIIGSNFDFEYKGIKSFKLNDICTFNIFNNKWYGVLELIENNILANEDIWLHDIDNWQINKFEFPSFPGEIASCEYIGTPEWNTGSVFIKKSSIFVLKYIVDSMKLNPIEYVGDENWISFLRRNTEISEYLYSINTEYCVGYTFFEKRLGFANKPVKVVAFKPGSDVQELFEKNNLIPKHLDTILKNHYASTAI